MISWVLKAYERFFLARKTSGAEAGGSVQSAGSIHPVTVRMIAAFLVSPTVPAGIVPAQSFSSAYSPSSAVARSSTCLDLAAFFVVASIDAVVAASHREVPGAKPGFRRLMIQSLSDDERPRTKNRMLPPRRRRD
jgi:hypothetical protein